METFQEQKAFFEKHWQGLKQAVEKGGGTEAVSFIEKFEGLEKRVMYSFARMGLVMGDWQNKNFDDYIIVVDHGIAMLEKEAEKAAEEHKVQWLKRLHALNYNLSADIADCWPGDDQPRTQEHFVRALKAAEYCIKLQDTIRGGDGILSMDYWAKGMHEFSLGKMKEAVVSWTKSYEYAKESAKQDGKTDEVTKNAPFGIILGLGYVGLARWKNGEDEGKAQYEKAITTFKEQTADEKLKGDAEFGIAQLEKVRQKYI
jgi:hypothetical protein